MDQNDILRIMEGELEIAFHLSQQIPEFSPPYKRSVWQDRLHGKKSLILVAYAGDTPVGFKVGMVERTFFYSWVGGILPSWRRRGIARMLADRQEEILRQWGVDTVRMKTRNSFKAMLIFALSNGFAIVETYPGDNPGSLDERRIVLEKKI